MKNITLLVLSLIILFIIGGILFVKAGNGSKNVTGTITGNVVNNVVDGSVQKIVLGMKNFNYYPSEIKVKAGKPVSISLDDSVFGCLKALTIKELGASKYLRSASDTLDFVPTQKGTFKIACSMGMGYGKLIVE